MRTHGSAPTPPLPYTRHTGSFGERGHMLGSVFPAQEGPVPRTPSLSRSAEQQERTLHDSLADNLITQEVHDRKLRELRNEDPMATLTELPSRTLSSGKTVLDLSDQWMHFAGPFQSRQEAAAAVRMRGALVHGHNGGQWKWNDDTTGGSRRHLHCNGHVDCPVLLRIKQYAGNDQSYYLEVTARVQHGLALNHFKRRNSPLSFGAEEAVDRSATEGKKPKQIKESLQSFLLGQHGAEKIPEGGMRGARDTLLAVCWLYCCR